jgi:hypothetical protein
VETSASSEARSAPPPYPAMLRIDAEIGVAHVRDASRDVICLIKRKAIQTSCNRRTNDGSAHEEEKEKHKEAQADSRRLPRLDWRWRDKSAQRSSGPVNESQEKME